MNPEITFPHAIRFYCGLLWVKVVLLSLIFAKMQFLLDSSLRSSSIKIAKNAALVCESRTYKLDFNFRIHGGITCQQASRYVNSDFTEDHFQIGEGLRFKGNPTHYHSLMIHRDDVPILRERYKAKARKMLGDSN